MLVKFTCSCGKIRMVERKVLWRTRFCEECAIANRKERRKNRIQKYYKPVEIDNRVDAEYLLVYDPAGMEDWPKTPIFSKTQVHLFPSGCQFRNLSTNETITI